jgi:hypothetical protein
MRPNAAVIAMIPVFTAAFAASQKLEIGSALVDVIVTITELRVA